jgi:hypothetical protein
LSPILSCEDLVARQPIPGLTAPPSAVSIHEVAPKSAPQPLFSTSGCFVRQYRAGFALVQISKPQRDVQDRSGWRPSWVPALSDLASCWPDRRG